MTSIREAVRRMIQPIRPLPAGMYHYQAPTEDPRNYRLHLRIEPDGTGLLIVNASTVLHLNQTACEYAYHLIHQTPQDQVAQTIARRYRVSNAQAQSDFLGFKERIELLIERQDIDPEIFLDFEPKEAGAPTSPLRLDCALTRQIPAGQDAIYYPAPPPGNEMTTQEWLQVIEKSWDFGIPQVIFTGGEPTLREDLILLIQRAEALGQVAGLVSDGFRLLEPAYLNQVLLSGLDHIILLFQPETARSWEVLEPLLKADLFITVHLTLTNTNQSILPEALGKIASQGVHAISLSESDPSLTERLLALRNQAFELDKPLVWGLPVPFSTLDPLSLESEGLKTHESAAHLYVDPGGEVHLNSTHPAGLGNLLTASWNEIWSQITRRTELTDR